MVRLLVGGVFGIAALLFSLFFYLGGFHKIEISQIEFGPVEIFYATHQGPYGKIGRSWNTFAIEREQAGLSVCDSLALYLDPPESPKDALRTIIACRMGALPANEQDIARAAFPTFMLPESKVLYTVFPYRNMLSYMFGPARVYPKIGAFIEQTDIKPVIGIEIYGRMDETDTIQFLTAYDIEKSEYRQLFEAF